MMLIQSIWFGAFRPPTPENPILLARTVIERVRTVWVDKTPLRSFDSAPRGAPLRMTNLWEL